MDTKEKENKRLGPQIGEAERLEKTPERELTVEYCSRSELTFQPPGCSDVSYTPACKGTMEIHANSQLYEYIYPVHLRGKRYYVSRRTILNKLPSFIRPTVGVAPMAELRISVPTRHDYFECQCWRCGDHTFPKHYEAFSVMQRIDLPHQQEQTTKAMKPLHPGAITEEMFQHLVRKHEVFTQNHKRCLVQTAGKCGLHLRFRKPDSLSLTAFGEIGAGVELDCHDFILNFRGEEMAERFGAGSWLHYTYDEVRSKLGTCLNAHARRYVNQGIKQAWAARKHYRSPRYLSANLADIPSLKRPCPCPACPGHFLPFESWPPEEIREVVEGIRSAQSKTGLEDAGEEKQQGVQQTEPYLCTSWSAEIACLRGVSLLGVSDQDSLAIRRFASRGPYQISKIPKDSKDCAGYIEAETWIRRKMTSFSREFGTRRHQCSQ